MAWRIDGSGSPLHITVEKGGLAAVTWNGEAILEGKFQNCCPYNPKMGCKLALTKREMLEIIRRPFNYEGDIIPAGIKLSK